VADEIIPLHHLRDALRMDTRIGFDGFHRGCRRHELLSPQPGIICQNLQSSKNDAGMAGSARRHPDLYRLDGRDLRNISGARSLVMTVQTRRTTVTLTICLDGARQGPIGSSRMGRHVMGKIHSRIDRV
jgi:hypothetical protein